MSLATALYTVLLKPLQLVFEFIYNVAYGNIKDPGLAIIALSLAINILVLPLYRRADAMQEEERDTEAKLSKWVTHIKKTFRGDERTMMLQTYYRQNHYSPTYVLRGATSLLLEIPFFIAAYRFLSGLELLEGAPFGPIADLSQPDALLHIGGLSVNLLPILMTVVNVISSAIFSKSYPRKTKIQLYAMAAFFLVFLYNSPAGLVFYWTLNNVFSLAKTIFYKLKNAKQILTGLVTLSGVALMVWAVRLFRASSRRTAVLLAFCGLLLCLPLVCLILKRKGKLNVSLPERKANTGNFLLGALFLAVLTGALIPSAVVSSSPQEFVDVTCFFHPLWYPLHSFLLGLGFFALWLGVFYWLASPKAKPIFECAVWALCGIATVDYFFFGTDLGTVSPDLIFVKGANSPIREIALNGAVILAVAAVFAFVFVKWGRVVPKILSVVLAVFVCMSAINCVQIRKTVAAVDLNSQTDDTSPHFTLSKTGKNVVVIMLDRAMGEYVPYLFNEKPELKEQFDGFTCYSNVTSFGVSTNFGAPPLYGGYEYTPVEMNKRDTELLKDKQNEALKVMPVLFSENGYDVTVFDPVYAGYMQIPDLSVYDDYPEIKSYNTRGRFSDASTKEEGIERRKRNFFCYGLMKTVPLLAQPALYNGGHYNSGSFLSGQISETPHISYGIGDDFMGAYGVLQNMTQMTRLEEKENGSLLLMSNDATHFSYLMSEPEYTPEAEIDNTEYDAAHEERFTVDGRTLAMEDYYQFATYETHMAVMIQLGAWFDYLRENGVYDNTRIILVSDHGYRLLQTEELDLGAKNDEQGNPIFHTYMGSFFPLLMVKDFDADGFSTSDEFMTNADVPTLAVSELIENPTNPMTGKPLNNAEKYSHDQYITASTEANIEDNHGTTFLPAPWYSVHDSIWNKENWTLMTEDEVLTKNR